VILFLHHRYRVPGGEERAVEDLMWLVSERLGEDAQLLTRDSAGLSRARAAAGLVGGGLHADEVARAVRRTRARVLHAHNVHPTLGWRALAAARDAGAAVVLHLHQYRLVCATGVCFRDGRECTSCRGANTLPGVLHNCRGSRAEAAAYAIALARWQRRLAAQVDVFIAPSAHAVRRLRELHAPLGPVALVPHVSRGLASGGRRAATGRPAPPSSGGHALLAARLVPEKGVEVAIDACRRAGVRLVIAGEGPERQRLEPRCPEVSFVGRLPEAELRALRESASVAVVPSLFAETFGLAAAEAMAAGVPVAASRIGALPELVPEPWLAPPGDAPALAAAIRRILADPGARATALERARRLTSPDTVAAALASAYEAAQRSRAQRAGAGGPGAGGPGARLTGA